VTDLRMDLDALGRLESRIRSIAAGLEALGAPHEPAVAHPRLASALGEFHAARARASSALGLALLGLAEATAATRAAFEAADTSLAGRPR